MLESLRQQQQDDNFSLLSGRSDNRRFFPSPSVNNSLLGKRPIVLDNMREDMLDLWKSKLQHTEQRQREQLSLVSFFVCCINPFPFIYSI